jgi:acyl-CoA reductase-like NAD-dependent aldehyde dehydrogenase
MSGALLGPAADLAPEEAARRVAAARHAAVLWRRTSVAQRVSALTAVWAALDARRAEALAVIREENGKPSLEAELVEFGSVSLLVRYFTANAERILGERSAWTPWFFFNKRASIRRLPRGVIGIIAPWNMPFLIPFGDSFCAMLAGNAVLLKPSEWTTRTALWLESAVAATGLLPEGLLTVLPGRAAAGEAVIDGSDLVMFTGSTKTGAVVAARAAAQLKPVILELGGKHPMIVCADAALERAAAGAVWGALANAGQVCVGVERVFVESAAHDAFVEKVKARVAALKTGGAADEEVSRFTFPPLLERVQAQLDDARKKGATVIGGEVLDRAGLRMAPALVLGAKPDMLVMRDETFGPVLAIMKVERAEEAVALANAGDTGLAASVWTTDPDRAQRLTASLDAGMIGINEPGTHYAYGALPFGGVKSSGMWRRHGDEGLLALTQAQSILEHEWPADMPDPWWFPRDERVIAVLRRLLGLH